MPTPQEKWAKAKAEAGAKQQSHTLPEGGAIAYIFNQFEPAEISAICNMPEPRKFIADKTRGLADKNYHFLLFVSQERVKAFVTAMTRSDLSPNLQEHMAEHLFDDMSPEQKNQMFDKMDGRWNEIIQSPNDFKTILKLLSPEQARQVAHEINDKLSTLFKSPEQLGSALERLPTNNILPVCETIQSSLVLMIDSLEEYTDLAVGLIREPAVIQDLFTLLKNHLVTIAKSPDDLDELEGYCTEEQMNELKEGVQQRDDKIANFHSFKKAATEQRTSSIDPQILAIAEKIHEYAQQYGSGSIETKQFMEQQITQLVTQEIESYKTQYPNQAQDVLDNLKNTKLNIITAQVTDAIAQLDDKDASQSNTPGGP
jgi:hypothetical protein